MVQSSRAMNSYQQLESEILQSCFKRRDAREGYQYICRSGVRVYRTYITTCMHTYCKFALTGAGPVLDSEPALDHLLLVEVR